MYLILSIASIVSVFPLYYMFCASTNKSVDVIAGKLIPGTYLIENYKALIANQNLGLALWNSFRNATVLTVLCLLICSIAGYVFEIYHDKGKDVVFTILLNQVGADKNLAMVVTQSFFRFHQRSGQYNLVEQIPLATIEQGSHTLILQYFPPGIEELIGFHARYIFTGP